MIRNNIVQTIGLLAAMIVGLATASAAPEIAEQDVQLIGFGKQLEAIR